MPTLQIRDFHEGDLEAVARVWHASWVSAGLASLTIPGVEHYRRRLETEGKSDWSIKLACAGMEIVGFVAFDRPRQWLRQIFVHPAAKRSGVGTLLLEVAKREMPDGFWLRTQPDNEAAKQFYVSRGLRPDGDMHHETRGGRALRYRWP